MRQSDALQDMIRVMGRDDYSPVTGRVETEEKIDLHPKQQVQECNHLLQNDNQ